MKVDKYFSTEFDIKNAHVVFSVDENFFQPSPTFNNRLHHHNKHEIFFVKQGMCKIFEEDADYHLREKSFIVITSGIDHNICDKSDNALIYAMKFQFFKNKKDREEDFDVFKLLNSLVIRKDPPVFYDCFNLFKKFEELLEVINTQKFLYHEYLNSAITLFFIDILLHVNNMQYNKYSIRNDVSENSEHIQIKGPKNQGVNVDCKNRQIYTDIIENYLGAFADKQISLTKLAELLQLSPNHTSRLLKQLYGASFVKLLAQTRIAAAKKMIIESNLSLEIVAEHVGYDSYHGFLHAFKKSTGKLPSDFRKYKRL